MAGDKNRKLMREKVRPQAEASIKEAQRLFALDPETCTPPQHIVEAGDVEERDSEGSGSGANGDVADRQRHREWMGTLEACKAELQGRAAPSGDYALGAAEERAKVLVPELKALYTQTLASHQQCVRVSGTLKRAELEDSICRCVLPEEPLVAAEPPQPAARGRNTDADPSDWVFFCFPETWFASTANWFYKFNDANPTKAMCDAAAKMATDGGDEDSDLRTLGDEAIDTIVTVTTNMENADAELELDAELAAERTSEDAVVAGDRADEVDAASVYGTGLDSEALEDEDEEQDEATARQDEADDREAADDGGDIDDVDE